MHERRQRRVGELEEPPVRNHDAGERKRHDDQRDGGNGHGVGHRCDQRHLLEQRERQRREPQRDDPLRVRALAQHLDDALPVARGAGGMQPSDGGIQQQRHRPVRQPEARRQRRPRVPQQHAGERPQPDDARAAGPPEPEADGGDREHRERAQRRNLRARQRDVGGRRSHADGGRHLARRPARRQPRAAAGKREREPAGKRGEDGDVQSRDRHQVPDPGAVEHRPLRLGDRPLVADRERDDHAGIRRVGQRASDAVAHVFARALHIVARTTGEGVAARVGGIAAHIARRAQPLLQQPRLEIEAAGIDVAVRSLQAHRQRPPLAGAHDRRIVVALPRAVPGKR